MEVGEQELERVGTLVSDRHRADTTLAFDRYQGWTVSE